MLGHRRPTDRQRVGEFADWPWPFRQALDDGSPGAIAEHSPFIARSVSDHER